MGGFLKAVNGIAGWESERGVCSVLVGPNNIPYEATVFKGTWNAWQNFFQHGNGCDMDAVSTLGILVAVQTLKETYVRVPRVLGGFEPPPDLGH